MVAREKALYVRSLEILRLTADGHSRRDVAHATAQQTPRDRHTRLIAERGRIAWQQATNYGRRSLGETAIGRYKHRIGPTLRARSLPGQQGVVALAVQALNRMIRIVKPVSVRVP